MVAYCIPPVSYANYFARENFLGLLDSLAGPLEQMAVAMICHPFGSGQMAVKGASRSLRTPVGIDVEDDARDLLPISIRSVGIQQPEIGDDMLLVIGRQHGVIRRQVRNIWVQWG